MSELKVGDKVFVDFTKWDVKSYSILTIGRETPTRWITNDGRQWLKSTLAEYGTKNDMWSSTRYLEELTEENQAKIESLEVLKKRERIWVEIRNLRCPHHISIERLQNIYKELKGE